MATNPRQGCIQKRHSRRVLILLESSVSSRYWEGAIPLLEASGTEIILGTVRDRGPLHEKVEAFGCRTFALGCRTSWNYPYAAMRLANFIRQNQIDIIHSCEAIPGSIGGMAGLVAHRPNTIFHRQHTFAKGKQKVFSWISSRLAHLTMAISEATAQYAHRLDGVPFSRIRVAYSGVEEPRLVSREELIALRHRLGIPEKAHIISIVARLRKEKGHYTLLDSIPLVAAGLAETPHVVIVGSGAEEKQLKKQAGSLSSAVFHFVGHQEDISPWFALGDVVAVPSYEEAFGLSAVEAMACSRPLVASRVGGLEEVVLDGITGILVVPAEPYSLASGLLRVLSSPETGARMGAAAYKRFKQRFTMEAMVDAWLDCYEELYQLPRQIEC